MTVDNFEESLTALMDRKSFRVFTIELHGGTRFEIDHPRAAIWRNGAAIFISPGGTPIWFDNERVNQIIEAPTNAAH